AARPPGTHATSASPSPLRSGPSDADVHVRGQRSDRRAPSTMRGGVQVIDGIRALGRRDLRSRSSRYPCTLRRSPLGGSLSVVRQVLPEEGPDLVPAVHGLLLPV